MIPSKQSFPMTSISISSDCKNKKVFLCLDTLCVEIFQKLVLKISQKRFSKIFYQIFQRFLAFRPFKKKRAVRQSRQPFWHRLEEDGPFAHAARGGDGGDEGRQGGHDDFHCDFQDSFLFLVHSFKGF